MKAHPDLVGRPAGSTAMPPTFHVIREPAPVYVLLLETSARMARVWKWARKAVQNLIRFQLPANARVAIVTFSKEARVEQQLAILTSEQVGNPLSVSLSFFYSFKVGVMI